MKKYFSIIDFYGWYGHLNVKFLQFWHWPNVFKICSERVLCLIFLLQKIFHCRLYWYCWKWQKALFFWTPDIVEESLTSELTVRSYYETEPNGRRRHEGRWGRHYWTRLCRAIVCPVGFLFDARIAKRQNNVRIMKHHQNELILFHFLEEKREFWRVNSMEAPTDAPNASPIDTAINASIDASIDAPNDAPIVQIVDAEIDAPFLDWRKTNQSLLSEAKGGKGVVSIVTLKNARKRRTMMRKWNQPGRVRN